MPHYRKPNRKPSQYRCLKGLYWSVIAMLMAFGYDQISSIPCNMKLLGPSASNCQVAMPWPVWALVIAFFCGGIVSTLYRAYRDFYKGDIYVDRGEF